MTKLYRIRDTAENWVADIASAYEAEAFAKLLDYEVTITEVYKLRKRNH